METIVDFVLDNDIRHCWVCGDESQGEVCSDPKCKKLGERLIAADPAWVEELRRREGS